MEEVVPVVAPVTETKSNKKLIFIIVGVLVVLGGITVFIMSAGKPKEPATITNVMPTAKPNSATTTTKVAPANNGTLYGDIQERLNEVLK